MKIVIWKWSLINGRILENPVWQTYIHITNDLILTLLCMVAYLEAPDFLGRSTA